MKTFVVYFDAYISTPSWVEVEAPSAEEAENLVMLSKLEDPELWETIKREASHSVCHDHVVRVERVYDVEETF